ncbi:hypothetical protein TNCV_293061, partial [Trichonephila clavipes]
MCFLRDTDGFIPPCGQTCVTVPQVPLLNNHKADIRRHMLIHSGEKPHACLQCHKRFTGEGSLRRASGGAHG